jgi:2-amino-4-hydroxy-6-hydroxymethyldihydropteridine diphosphokinase
MIIIGLGANLPNPVFGPPKATLDAALSRLGQEGLRIVARSPWYETEPIPRGDQPWFVNGVAAVETALDPGELLQLLLRVEEGFGRVRSVPNAPRTLDLDLLAYDDFVLSGSEPPILPHPRLHERAFVLLPLQDIAPGWIHPRLKLSIADLVASLPEDQVARRLGS